MGVDLGGVCIEGKLKLRDGMRRVGRERRVVFLIGSGVREGG